MNDIHDNLAPIAFPMFTKIDIFIGILFIAIVIGLLLQKWMRKPIPQKMEKKEKGKGLSWKKEIRHLQKLAKQEDWKNFTLDSTSLLKQILEIKYVQNFPDRTSEEIIQNAVFPQEEKKKLIRFFQNVDPVKFASQKSPRDSSQIIFEELEYFYSLKNSAV